MYIYIVYIQCKHVLFKNRSPSLGDPLVIFGWSLGSLSTTPVIQAVDGEGEVEDEDEGDAVFEFAMLGLMMPCFHS